MLSDRRELVDEPKIGAIEGDAGEVARDCGIAYSAVPSDELGNPGR
jgi:hypothetical protein